MRRRTAPVLQARRSWQLAACAHHPALEGLGSPPELSCGMRRAPCLACRGLALSQAAWSAGVVGGPSPETQT